MYDKEEEGALLVGRHKVHCEEEDSRAENDKVKHEEDKDANQPISPRHGSRQARNVDICVIDGGLRDNCLWDSISDNVKDHADRC